MKFLFIFIAVFLSMNSRQQIKNYDLKKFDQQLVLHKSLNEISALALNNNQRLFALQDEAGKIYELDIISGNILKIFTLGRTTINADFEGLAIVGESFFAVTSSGILYEFNEGKNNESVIYQTYHLGFDSKFDIEGLCYDRKNNSLLIAPKEYAGKNYEEHRAIYSFELGQKKINPKPKFLISLNQLKDKFNIKDFFPSAIEYNELTGSYFILSSKGKSCLVEIDIEGNVTSAAEFDKKNHRQPEGIAFLNSGTMLISDEASGKSPTLTFYLYHE